MLSQMQVALMQELLANDMNPAVDVDETERKTNVKFMNENF